MRVISGSARGKQLKALEGLDTRPTTDRVKESVFNIIQFDIEGRKILDLFAGSGQMGIESLSRGAAHCTFVEMRRDAAAIVRENLNLTGLSGQSKLVQGESIGFLTSCKETFDVIFLDPPYQTNLLEQALETIVRFDILKEHGIIICESLPEKALPTLPVSYEEGREYRYGTIKLKIYRRIGSDPHQ